ncbi:MAG: glycosyl hydrolase 53 family protein [Marinilabiliaceae bacterium]|nr:glycosyl hydrolase 53 family protein [Marinilabiliaceae bacterium]
MIGKYFYLFIFIFCISFFSCNYDDDVIPSSSGNEEPVEDMSGFAKGADVSWVTEMEKAGVEFFDSTGAKTECMALMKKLGMNSIRLRVWVNPVTGWCNKTDVLVKAKRASNLKMRVMIDFHYSDVWADPANQTKPADWQNMTFVQLCDAVTAHTTEVLSALKTWEITPEWVQVGNETGNGMLWDDGKANANMANYAKLNNCGYDAVKSVFPNAKVIVHLQEGNKNAQFRWLFDGLKNNGGKWDVIGMSLYPEADTWQTFNNDIILNVNDMISRYNKEVVICEVGMSWVEEDAAYNFLSDLITRSKAIEKCMGVFYWEPQAYAGWKSYDKGAFDDSGKPTKALDAFQN